MVTGMVVLSMITVRTAIDITATSKTKIKSHLPGHRKCEHSLGYWIAVTQEEILPDYTEHKKKENNFRTCFRNIALTEFANPHGMQAKQSGQG
jgi:hypothetical protein